MPTFCRHNRFAENCPICAKTPRTAPSSPAISRQPERRTSSSSPTARRKPASSGTSTRKGARGSSRAGAMTVRKMARAAEDGFHSDLVPGLRATEDARRLADELAFSAARLAELSADPPGLLAEVATLEDREEAAWLLFLVAWISPAEGDDPWSGISAARVSWASGELPAVADIELGPRTACDPGRAEMTVTRYRQWASRAGGQLPALAGETAWTPHRRFDRAFERLAFPGFHRSARYELLVLAGRLGLVDAEPSSLQLGVDPMDPVVLAAKRVFGIGDAINLGRRSSELAEAAGVPVAALDLALLNWSRPTGRVTAGSRAEADPAVHDRLLAALGVRAE